MQTTILVYLYQVVGGEYAGNHVIADADDASPLPPQGDGPEAPEFSHIMFEDAAKISLEIALPFSHIPEGQNMFTLSELQYKLCIKKGKVNLLVYTEMSF